MEYRDENFDSEVEFVARHWRQDAFEPKQAMERAGLVGSVRGQSVWSRLFGRSYRTVNRDDVTSQPGRRRVWTAAASAAVVLMAAAAGLYLGLKPSEPTVVEMPPVTVETVACDTIQQPQRMQVKRIEFENASLAEVTAAIESTYGVTLENVPVASEQRITMSYSGTADDVVETLNELFSLHITISDDDR
ncbi:MAG: DUF4974 domain-containing protein [Muribaculaceae bacterium]|nr:DUF4974 domain-containing protein [Bacteroides sp.]MDE6681672.1 DUF4974 domain-containing protein [Muribaculaceae bacterium]MDE6843736.1 DUF4974 domain-containing protein [Muribaculaceae bacterium]MDE7189029.1 DUF4974 domain-containing protein [Muribaculaceae bacterium]